MGTSSWLPFDAQSPAAAFPVSPAVFYSQGPGRNSRYWAAACRQCERRRFLPHHAKAPPPAPTRRTPAATAGRSAPSGPAPGRMAAAWLAVAERVTGVSQLESDVAAPVVGSVAEGVGVASAVAAGAAGSASACPAAGAVSGAGAAGTCAGEEGTAGCGAAGEGAAGEGEAGCPGSSPGLGVLVGRGSAVCVAVGSPVHVPPQSGGTVVAVVAVGSAESGGSASAAPPAGRLMESARMAAAAVVEAARTIGDGWIMDTFRCAQSPLCRCRVSKKSSTTRRRAANPSNVRPSGYKYP